MAAVWVVAAVAAVAPWAVAVAAAVVGVAALGAQVVAAAESAEGWPNRCLAPIQGTSATTNGVGTLTQLGLVPVGGRGQLSACNAGRPRYIHRPHGMALRTPIQGNPPEGNNT